MISLDELRTIVNANKPYDTGYMFTFGTRFNETAHYLVAEYDLLAVPYIEDNEEGYNNNPNKGFISEKTISEINFAVSMGNAGLKSTINPMEEKNKLRSTLVSAGVMEHLTNYGEQGGVYEQFVG